MLSASHRTEGYCGFPAYGSRLGNDGSNVQQGPDFHRLNRTTFAAGIYSITSSAMLITSGESVSPIVLAALRLMTISNLLA